MGQIKPAINPKGYRTSLKDYNETSVIEEIAANSYDAMASTAVFLLDDLNSTLLVYDDGKGFNHTAMEEMLTIGGGSKENLYAEPGGRIYLGSYGFGFKAITNISNEISVITCSEEDNQKYSTKIDLSELDKRMSNNSEGYNFKEENKPDNSSKGTILKLKLKNPTSKAQLDEYIKVLGNLPNDTGGFNCYCGLISNIKTGLNSFEKNFKGLKELAKTLHEQEKLQIVTNLFDSELSECEIIDVSDKDNDASGKIYFAGMNGDKPKNLKESLRGVYVRVNGRLLKNDFSNDKYTGGISKYIQFKSSMRTELSIDWLRSEITLSRDGIKFNNSQLEVLFKRTVGRLITQFITPQLSKLNKAKEKIGNKKFKQRLELSKKRLSKSADVVIKSINAGFVFKPETDAELAILIAQDAIMKKINPSYTLLDYNAQFSFDCMLYDESRDEFIYTELEPNLEDFIYHTNKSYIVLLIVWTLGKWKIGATKKGSSKEGWFRLIHINNSPKGHYKLIQVPSEDSQKAKRSFQVIVINEILK